MSVKNIFELISFWNFFDFIKFSTCLRIYVSRIAISNLPKTRSKKKTITV